MCAKVAFRRIRHTSHFEKTCPGRRVRLPFRLYSVGGGGVALSGWIYDQTEKDGPARAVRLIMRLFVRGGFLFRPLPGAVFAVVFSASGFAAAVRAICMGGVLCVFRLYGLRGVLVSVEHGKQ